MSKLSKNAQSGLSNLRRSLDAPSIYLNPVWKDGKFVDLIKFGATTGQIRFEPEVTYREREFNGASRTPMMGNQVLETVAVTATATLAELTTALIQKTIKGDIEDLGDGRKRHIPRVLLSEEDYIEKVLIVNWLPDGDWWGIMMYNVLFTSPFAVESEDNGDFSMEVTMTAHNDPNDPDAANKIPYEIISSKSMNPVQGELQENAPTTEPEVPGRTIIEVFNEVRSGIIPFESQTIEDESLPEGQTIVDQQGEDGLIKKTFEITVWSDGYREERLIDEDVEKEPTNELIRVGSGAPRRDVPFKIDRTLHDGLLFENTDNEDIIGVIFNKEGDVLELRIGSEWQNADIILSENPTAGDYAYAYIIAYGENGAEYEIDLTITDYDMLTVEELKQALDGHGVEYSSEALKPELMQLVFDNGLY